MQLTQAETEALLLRSDFPPSLLRTLVMPEMYRGDLTDYILMFCTGNVEMLAVWPKVALLLTSKRTSDKTYGPRAH